MNLGFFTRTLLVLLLAMPFLSRGQDCYPTDQYTVTQRTSQGTLFMSESTTVPTFCTDFGTSAPAVGDVFNPVPAGVIEYDNQDLTTSEIEDRVARTLAVFNHPDYGLTPLPTSLTSNFYKVIQYTIWTWTDGESRSASYVANDGNTYTADDLRTWVLNGTLEAASVVWLQPNKSNIQSEVTLNLLTNPDAGSNGTLTICSNTTLNEKDLFNALNGTPQEGGTWTPDISGAGTYSYTITGQGSCEDATAQVVVSYYNLESSVTQPVCGGKKGRIEVTSPVGSEYQYKINDGNYQSSPVFINLEDGEYTIVAERIADGCEINSSEITIINEVCASNDEKVTDSETPVCDNLLLNDQDGQGYTLEVESAEVYNESGQKVAITLDGAENDVYDANGIFAGTFTLIPNGDFCYFPHRDFDGLIPVDYILIDSEVSRMMDNATLEITVSNRFLPVEFIEFIAHKMDDQTKLRWITGIEINNDYFEVQRSDNGMDWEIIGKVLGNGNSNSSISYHFLDRNPNSGNNYYRLKQVDFDGAFSFSEIRILNFNSREENNIQVYPTITKDYVRINSNLKIVKSRIISAIGNFIAEYRTEENELNLENLTNGVYYIQLIGENESVLGIDRIIKVK